MKKYILIAILTIYLLGCSDNSTEPAKEPTTIEDLVIQAGFFKEENFQFQKTDLGTVNEKVSDGENDYVSTSQKKKLVNRFDEIAAFSSNYADVLYPGAIVQGKEVIDGKLSSIAGVPRNPIKIQLQGGNSEQIDQPSNSTITQGIRNILKKDNPQVANMTYSLSEMYSSEQAFLELGLNVKWLPGSLSSKFEKSSDFKKNSIFLFFKQVYYTISVENPANASSLFQNSVSVDDLKSTIYKGNPPLLISSVSYGRMIIVKITSEESINEMRTQVEGSLFGLGKGGSGFDKSKYNLNSTFDAIIVGGSSQGAAEAITNTKDLDQINKLIQSEANFSESNPGYPISYTLRYIQNNKAVNLGKATEYLVPSWQLDPSQFQEFDFIFSHFEIIDDGNFWTDGNFSFEVKVEDKNGNIVKDISGNDLLIESVNNHLVGSGSNIHLSKIFNGVKIKKGIGQKFIVKATLWDHFSSGKIVEAGFQGFIYDFPWNLHSRDVVMPLVSSTNEYETKINFSINQK